MSGVHQASKGGVKLKLGSQ